jgi:pSer/pThr/pTyr-binding forkhead associated (FHA) protein
VAAVVIFVVMTARSKAAAQKQEADQQIDAERRKAESARLEAERLRVASTRAPAPPGPGGTVVASAPAASGSKATPARTIVSIGAVEVVTGPHQGQKFPLQSGETRVGRTVKDGIALDRDGEVSSQHGSLIVTVDGHVLYRDESTNGSILDGTTVHHRQAEAHSGSQLEIGASTLLITLRASTASSAPQPTPIQAVVSNPGKVAPLPESAAVSAAPAPKPAGSRSAATIAIEVPPARAKTPAAVTQATLGAELEVLSGPEAGQRFAITRSVMGLGREDQDILLNEDSISRKHATLVYRDGKFLLTDQRSTHGTKVNGESIGSDAHELVNGDRIALGTGQTTLVFHSLVS